MQEYVTEALVLDKESFRDLDVRYSFFTKRYGKVVGKATSARKITSKLAGHLEPGNFVQARFLERNHGSGTQIADALKLAPSHAPLADLASLNRILAEGEADAALWNALAGGRFSWPLILAILGWDPRHAACATCGRAAAAFFIPRQDFFCAACASKLDRSALILLVHAEV